MAAVVATRTPSAIHCARSMSTYAAHAASALDMLSSASFTATPTDPEKNAISRGTIAPLGVSSGNPALEAVLALTWGPSQSRSRGAGAPRGARTVIRCRSADLGGDRAPSRGERGRGLRRTRALRRPHPRLAEIGPDAAHLRDVRHRDAALAGLAELRENRVGERRACLRVRRPATARVRECR